MTKRKVHTISALVENRPGVLAKMAREFKSHRVNITSISSAQTEQPELSRMIICVESPDEEVAEVTRAISAMDFVERLEDLEEGDLVARELVLIKLNLEMEKLSQIMQILEVCRATVVSMGQTTMTVELAGDTDRVDGLVRLVSPFGVKAMCRTGKIALKRGDEE
jgi:acetolactate synthase-1/3 small subunit